MAQTGHLVLINSENDFIITELCRIAEDIKSAWTVDQTLKKYRSLRAQLSLFVPPNSSLKPCEKLDLLKSFFFGQKQFGPLASKPGLDKCLLPYILLSRSGPPEMLLLLFTSLAKTLHMEISVLDSQNRIILKVIDHGKSRLFDFQKQCAELSTNEVVDLINHGCDGTKTLSETDLLIRYLLLVKTQCLRERSLMHFYKMQTYLVHYQPFALHHLVDRARAAYAIGDIVKAAEDISQYVAFHSEKVTNNRYLKLIQKIKNEKILKNLPYF